MYRPTLFIIIGWLQCLNWLHCLHLVGSIFVCAGFSVCICWFHRFIVCIRQLQCLFLVVSGFVFPDVVVYSLVSVFVCVGNLSVCI